MKIPRFTSLRAWPKEAKEKKPDARIQIPKETIEEIRRAAQSGMSHKQLSCTYPQYSANYIYHLAKGIYRNKGK